MATNAEKCMEWAKKNPELKKKLDRVSKDRLFYGGNREFVLERDNWQCQECGISQEQHLILFNRRLGIHHIDGQGYNKKIKNNDPDNLMTVCVRCHPKIDAECLKVQIKKGTNVNPISKTGGRTKGDKNKPKMITQFKGGGKQ